MISAIRFRWRFRRSCSISSFIVVVRARAAGEDEVVLGDRTEDEALQALEVEEPVLEGSCDGLGHGLTRVLAAKREEPAQGEGAAAGTVSLELERVLPDRLTRRTQFPFLERCFLLGRLAAAGPMLRRRHPHAPAAGRLAM